MVHPPSWPSCSSPMRRRATGVERGGARLREREKRVRPTATAAPPRRAKQVLLRTYCTAPSYVRARPQREVSAIYIERERAEGRPRGKTEGSTHKETPRRDQEKSVTQQRLSAKKSCAWPVSVGTRRSRGRLSNRPRCSHGWAQPLHSLHRSLRRP